MQVNACAFAPLTSEIVGIVLVEVARGSNKRVAFRAFVTALVSVNRTARTTSTVKRLFRVFLDISSGADMRAACSLLLTTGVGIGVLAILICAKGDIRVGFVYEIRGTLLRQASSLVIATSVPVLSFTCGVNTLDNLSVTLEHITVIANVAVATRSEVTAGICVSICAHKTLTIKCVSIPFMHMTFRARIRMTLIFLSTARMEVSISAILVRAENVGSIVPVLVTWRTLECVALTFLSATSIPILRQTCAIDTQCRVGIPNKNIMLRANCFIAMCLEITASVCVVLRALPSLAEQF